MINAQGVTIGVEALVTTVDSMVRYSVEQNIEALDENIAAAAKKAADELRVTGAEGIAQWRGRTSISQDVGAYRAGWQAYHYKPTEDSVLAVVANSHMPTITRLLELGHDKVVFGKRGGRVRGNGAIARAYENARGIAEGGVVS